MVVVEWCLPLFCMQVIFFSGIAQKSKYSNHYLGLPSNFLLESLIRKVQKYEWKAIYHQGGGVPGKEYECRVSLLYFWICAFESICIQFLMISNCIWNFALCGRILPISSTLNKQLTRKRKKGYQSNKKIGKNTKYCDIEIVTEKVLG